MMGKVIQIITAIFGGSAILLRNSRFKRIGNLIGLISCPCWIILEIYYGQYWILPVNVLYIIGWWKGFYKSWIK